MKYLSAQKRRFFSDPLFSFNQSFRKSTIGETSAFLHACHFTIRWGKIKREVVNHPIILFLFPYFLVSWTYFNFRMIFSLLKSSAVTVKKLYGLDTRAQFFSMIRYSFSVPMYPMMYYIFERYKTDSLFNINYYIHKYQLKSTLYHALLPQKGLSTVSPLTDKVSFHKKCVSAGLPVPNLLYTNSDASFSTGVAIPQKDLFTKPIDRKGGTGAIAWQYDSGSDTLKSRIGTGISVARSSLIDYLDQYYSRQKYLVQDRVFNHPAIQEFAGSATSTCRIVTFINEDYEPEITHAYVRISTRADTAVDNMHRGGLGALIDVETGRLGLASNLGIQAEVDRLTHNPVSGKSISGVILPFWEDAKQLATRTHREFLPRLVGGWDICITDTGAVLIEGNARPCIDFTQRMCGPFGEQRFGQLLAFHLRRRGF